MPIVFYYSPWHVCRNLVGHSCAGQRLYPLFRYHSEHNRVHRTQRQFRFMGNAVGTLEEGSRKGWRYRIPGEAIFAPFFLAARTRAAWNIQEPSTGGIVFSFDEWIMTHASGHPSTGDRYSSGHRNPSTFHLQMGTSLRESLGLPADVVITQLAPRFFFNAALWMDEPRPISDLPRGSGNRRW